MNKKLVYIKWKSIIIIKIKKFIWQINYLDKKINLPLIEKENFFLFPGF